VERRQTANRRRNPQAVVAEADVVALLRHPNQDSPQRDEAVAEPQRVAAVEPQDVSAAEQGARVERPILCSPLSMQTATA